MAPGVEHCGLEKSKLMRSFINSVLECRGVYGMDGINSARPKMLAVFRWQKGHKITQAVISRRRMGVRFIGFPVFAVSFLAMPSIGHAACQHSTAHYDLPAQRLDARLQQLAHTNGCPIEVDLSPRQGAHRAPPLRGAYKPQDALRRSIKGSGLEALPTADGYALRPTVRKAAHR